MTLGRTPAGAIKIKTDGGLRAVECACCGGGVDCGYQCIPTPESLKAILQNWKTVTITYSWPGDPEDSNSWVQPMSGAVTLAKEEIQNFQPTTPSFINPNQFPPPRDFVFGSLSANENCICFFLQEGRYGDTMYLAPKGSVQFGGDPFPYPLIKSGDGPLNIVINGVACPAWDGSVGAYIEPFAYTPTISLNFAS